MHEAAPVPVLDPVALVELAVVVEVAPVGAPVVEVDVVAAAPPVPEELSPQAVPREIVAKTIVSMCRMR